MVFFFNDAATTEIYTLSLHDALPILRFPRLALGALVLAVALAGCGGSGPAPTPTVRPLAITPLRTEDRKSTRLNSSHANISYAVFCLKKNNKTPRAILRSRDTTGSVS